MGSATSSEAAAPSRSLQDEIDGRFRSAEATDLEMEVASLQGGSANGGGSHGQSHYCRGEQEESAGLLEIAEDREQNNHPRRAVPEPSQPTATPAPTATAVHPDSAATGVEDPGGDEVQEYPVVRHSPTTGEGRKPLRAGLVDVEDWFRRLDIYYRGSEQQSAEEVQEMSEGHSSHSRRAAREPSQPITIPGPPTTAVLPHSAATGVVDPGSSELQENRVDSDMYSQDQIGPKGGKRSRLVEAAGLARDPPMDLDVYTEDQTARDRCRSSYSKRAAKVRRKSAASPEGENTKNGQ